MNTIIASAIITTTATDTVYTADRIQAETAGKTTAATTPKVPAESGGRISPRQNRPAPKLPWQGNGRPPAVGPGQGILR